MRSLSNLHPLTIIIYFFSVTLTAMFVWNPIIQIISLSGAAAFRFLQKPNDFRKSIIYLPLFLIVSLSNPIFSHNGATVLFFVNDIPFTLESLMYGLCAGIMILAVLFWFQSASDILTSEKLLSVFGNCAPRLCLALSMSLRFIPMFLRQAKKMKKAQRVTGVYSSDSYKDKLKGTLSCYSALITWSLENSIETSNSMKARGYSLKNHSSYSIFRFTPADAFNIIVYLIIIAIILIGVKIGATEFEFYPVMSNISLSSLSMTLYISYGILCFLPVISELKEIFCWKYFVSKI